MQDVRSASEELARKEMEEFVGDVSNSQLCPLIDSVLPTGEWKHYQMNHRVMAYINILGIPVSLWFGLSTVFVLVSLQNILNVDRGVGLAKFFSSTFFMMIIDIASPILLSLLGSKYAISTGYVLFLIYTMMDYYPSWYTLTTRAFFPGFSFGTVLWTGVYSQLTLVALKIVCLP